MNKEARKIAEKFREYVIKANGEQYKKYYGSQLEADVSNFILSLQEDKAPQEVSSCCKACCANEGWCSCCDRPCKMIVQPSEGVTVSDEEIKEKIETTLLDYRYEQESGEVMSSVNKIFDLLNDKLTKEKH